MKSTDRKCYALEQGYLSVPRNGDLGVVAHDAGRSPQPLGHFSALGYLKSARCCGKHAPRQGTRGRLLLCLFSYSRNSTGLLFAFGLLRTEECGILTCPMPREISSRRSLDEASIASRPGALTVRHLERDLGQERNDGCRYQIVRMAHVSGVRLLTRSICSIFGSVLVRADEWQTTSTAGSRSGCINVTRYYGGFTREICLLKKQGILHIPCSRSAFPFPSPCMPALYHEHKIAVTTTELRKLPGLASGKHAMPSKPLRSLPRPRIPAP